ncbi:MAG: CoA transferase [Deltaproteobacteria bacterium]|nr:CoA transferase [Deltaproteobacteria bacterium]MBW2053315.1 CoA transferase [Deltaproteobacteria bacterium]MBW2142455.1 CoA transferase [Deltaproteobacteria bacterium]MBW2324572.1 CoA transferase [Deltaproteobacteria bacterium]
MGEVVEKNSALSDLIVLDLTDEKGAYCTKIIADMGADVIKIEKPGGDDTRDLPPFANDVEDREKSLSFWHYNTNKRGITLNLEVPKGQEIYKKLAEKADIIVESYPPGYLDKLGLGYQDLSPVNPGLIMTSITPFGQTGPYRDYKSSDMVGCAMGGFMTTHGYPDQPPVILYGDQGFHMASNNAAIATLIALYFRDMTGDGQFIDVSMQAAVAASVEVYNLVYIYQNDVMKRQGTRHATFGPGEMGNLIPCKDGFICTFGSPGPYDWMEADGVAGKLLEDPRWVDDIEFIREPENQAYLRERQIEFAKFHDKEEIFIGCQNMHVPWAKVNNFEDMFNDPQLRDRGFCVEVEHPELETSFIYPGAPYKHTETPWKITRRAPLIGEHNEEVYTKRLGFSKEELSQLAQKGVI